MAEAYWKVTISYADTLLASQFHVGAEASAVVLSAFERGSDLSLLGNGQAEMLPEDFSVVLRGLDLWIRDTVLARYTVLQGVNQTTRLRVRSAPVVDMQMVSPGASFVFTKKPSSISVEATKDTGSISPETLLCYIRELQRWAIRGYTVYQ